MDPFFSWLHVHALAVCLSLVGAWFFGVIYLCVFVWAAARNAKLAECSEVDTQRGI